MYKEGKRLKVKGIKNFIPRSYNFSEIASLDVEDNGDGTISPNILFSDNGEAVEKMEDGVEFERLMLQVLSNLSDREKIVFVYQILRDSGFQIDHGSFAKTLDIGRKKYMVLLKEVKIKTLLMIDGKSIFHTQTDNK